MSQKASTEPLDFIRLLLDEKVVVKLRGSREIAGKLQAYDSHCNIVLSDAEETIYDIPVDGEELTKKTKNSDIIFVRGDSVILVRASTDE